MAEHYFLEAATQSTPSRSERAIFLLLICYLVEELTRPAVRLARTVLAKSFHLSATGSRLRH